MWHHQTLEPGGYSMSQVVTESRAVRLLKQLKIFDQWDAAMWAYRQGWEIDKGNFIFWTILNILGALIPVYLLRVTKEIIDYISVNITSSSLFDIAWRIALLCCLWVLRSSYRIIPEIIRYTMQTRYSIAMQRRYAICVGRIPLGKFDDKTSPQKSPMSAAPAAALLMSWGEPPVSSVLSRERPVCSGWLSELPGSCW